MARPLLEERFPLTVAPAGRDVAVAFFPPGNHVRQQFRRVLEVGVHDDQGVAFGVVHAGQHGRFLAEITRQGHVGHARIFFVELAQNGQGPVAAAVVDEDEGEGVVCQAADDGARPFVELGQDGFFVIAGDEDIYLFHRLSPPAAARFRRTV